MTQVWRLHSRPKENNGADPTPFCVERGVLGVAWGGGVDGADEQTAPENYEELALKQGYNEKGWKTAFNALAHRMRPDDLCWTRDANGVYFLGRLTAEFGWRYYGNTPDYGSMGINQGRPCQWFKVGREDQVPGGIRNSFIKGWTLQEIDSRLAAFSEFTYNQISRESRYDVTGSTDVWSLFPPDEVEDIIGLYLQRNCGYLVVPSTSKRGTARFEYFLVHKERRESAAVQVKSGQERLDKDEYAKDAKNGLIVYLFAVSGDYLGHDHENVRCISRTEIERFLETNRSILPDSIKKWLELATGSLEQSESK